MFGRKSAVPNRSQPRPSGSEASVIANCPWTSGIIRMGNEDRRQFGPPLQKSIFQTPARVRLAAR
jgi:hypothetical protein